MNRRLKSCIPGDPTVAQIAGPASITRGGAYEYQYTPLGDGVGPFDVPHDAPVGYERKLAEEALSASQITWTTAGTYLDYADVSAYKDEATGIWYNNRLTFNLPDTKFLDTCIHLYASRKNGELAYKMIRDESAPAPTVVDVKPVISTNIDKYLSSVHVSEFIKDSNYQSFLLLDGSDTIGLNSETQTVKFIIHSTDFPDKTTVIVQPISDEEVNAETAYLAISGALDAPLLHDGHNKYIETAGFDINPDATPPVKLFLSEIYDPSNQELPYLTLTITLVIETRTTPVMPLTTISKQYILDKTGFPVIPD